MDEIVLRPIGVVRNDFETHPTIGWDQVVSELVLRRELAEAADGLEGFSHIIVVFWMHKTASQRVPLKQHPRGMATLPAVGPFACRSPLRPNPIGITVVKLLGRSGNKLTVKGLDALDGTPILDIKPYLPRYNAPTGATEPDWVR